MPGSGLEAYSLVVLGRGTAAVAAAREAARRGVRVALLAPSRPSADESSAYASGACAFADCGAEADDAQAAGYRGVVRRLQARQGLLPPPLPLDEPRIEVLDGPWRFHRYRTVLAGDVQVAFRRAVIATGTGPAPVDIAGADAAPPLRPDELERLEAPPRRLAVLGGEGEACFWAQQLRRLGSEVHLIAAGSRLLADCPPRAADIVHARLRAEGVHVHVDCGEIRLDRTGCRRGVLLGGRMGAKILADEVLVCGARRPNLAGLALENAAVRYGERGIVIDDWLRTSDSRVYAAGGACGLGFASPEAEEGTGRLAVHNALAWRPRRLSAMTMPRYTPTDPPIVELRSCADGAAMEAAAERSLEFRDPSGPWGSGAGWISVRLDGRGRLTHAAMVAAEAESLALPLMLLMDRHRPLSDLRRLIACRSGLGKRLLALAR